MSRTRKVLTAAPYDLSHPLLQVSEGRPICEDGRCVKGFGLHTQIDAFPGYPRSPLTELTRKFSA